MYFHWAAVLCRPEEQHCEQPAAGEAAGHALMFRELDGGNREKPAHKEPRQVEPHAQVASSWSLHQEPIRHANNLPDFKTY